MNSILIFKLLVKNRHCIMLGHCWLLCKKKWLPWRF